MKATFIAVAAIACLALVPAASAQTTTSSGQATTSTSTTTTTAITTTTSPMSSGLLIVQHPDGTCTVGQVGTLVPCSSVTPSTVVLPGQSATYTPPTLRTGGTGVTQPGLPNTGRGGDAAANVLVILGASMVLAGSAYLLSKRKTVVEQ